MYTRLLNLISQQNTPGFFLTVESKKEADTLPEDIQHFIGEKLKLIDQGVTTRKFVYNKNGWRLIFTFFPTNEVVDEKYALKNKVYKRL